eukprot:1334985-Rhodomonas_salina.9
MFGTDICYAGTRQQHLPSGIGLRTRCATPGTETVYGATRMTLFPAQSVLYGHGSQVSAYGSAMRSLVLTWPMLRPGEPVDLKQCCSISTPLCTSGTDIAYGSTPLSDHSRYTSEPRWVSSYGPATPCPARDASVEISGSCLRARYAMSGTCIVNSTSSLCDGHLLVTWQTSERVCGADVAYGTICLVVWDARGVEPRTDKWELRCAHAASACSYRVFAMLMPYAAASSTDRSVLLDVRKMMRYDGQELDQVTLSTTWQTLSTHGEINHPKARVQYNEYGLLYGILIAQRVFSRHRPDLASAICLRACYAKSGINLAYSPTASAPEKNSGSQLRCPVLTGDIVLRYVPTRDPPEKDASSQLRIATPPGVGQVSVYTRVTPCPVLTERIVLWYLPKRALRHVRY